MSWFFGDKTKNGMAERHPETSLVRISDFLTKDRILFVAPGTEKRDLFAKLVDVLNLPEPDIALRSVLAREQIGSTLLEKGVAVPHARVHGVERIHAALGILSPAEETRLCLLFVGPTNDMKGHLGFLASCAALFQNQDMRESILRLKSRTEIVEKIRAYEHAASGLDGI
jgi:mannitol/fructose-specific phosphotransferase system IIA component (Ntr-type)